MNTGTISQLESENLLDTEQIGARLGSQLQGGEVISLVSDLGGGKTAFVRGLAAGAGSDGHVASPTFTLSREYGIPARSLVIKHFDLYRLHDAGLISYELDDYLDDPQVITIIEWGGIIDGVLPAKRLIIEISRTGETFRILKIANPYTHINMEPQSC